MPVVYVHAKEPWLPALPQPVPGTDEEVVFHTFIDLLPSLVVETMNEIDERSIGLTREEVVVYLTPIHPWAKNASDWCIDVQASTAGLVNFPARARQRRFATANYLADCIVDFFADQSVDPPSFDIEIRPIDGSGLTFIKDLGIVSVWGK